LQLLLLLPLLDSQLHLTARDGVTKQAKEPRTIHAMATMAAITSIHQHNTKLIACVFGQQTPG
jgi:hypothetical protein